MIRRLWHGWTTPENAVTGVAPVSEQSLQPAIPPGVNIMTATRFPRTVLDEIERRASLRIRAGSARHRFLGIWAVVVKGRVFVRSWNDKPGGWYRAWREDPLGAIEVASREIAVRAKPVRGEKLLDAISAAYRERYTGPGARKFADGMDEPSRRKTTLELTPVS